MLIKISVNHMANMCISIAALFCLVLPLMSPVTDSCCLLDIKSPVIQIYNLIIAFNLLLISQNDCF